MGIAKVAEAYGHTFVTRAGWGGKFERRPTREVKSEVAVMFLNHY